MLEAAARTGDLLVKVLEVLEGGEGKLTRKCVHIIELSTNLREVSQCLLNCLLGLLQLNKTKRLLYRCGRKHINT